MSRAFQFFLASAISMIGFCSSEYVLSSGKFKSTSNGSCDLLCMQTDENDKCWTKTRTFFDEKLLSHLNDWIALEINFDQWSRRNNPRYIFDLFNTTNTTIDERAGEAINRLSPYMLNYFVLDAETLSTIVKSLLNNAFSAIKAKAVDAHSSLIYVNMPEFRCPIPCQYDNQLWQYLFVASLLINVALILLIVPFIFKTERRDKQLYAKQMNLNSASSSSTNGGNLKKMLKKSPKNDRDSSK